MIIPEYLENPTGGGFDAGEAHRADFAPPDEHGLVSIMGPIGILYDNIIGTSGVASAGQNWDRLDSAARRWGIPLAEDKAFSYSYFLTTPCY